MAVNKIAGAIISMVVMASLSGCSTASGIQFSGVGPAHSANDIIYINGESTDITANDQLAKLFLVESDYNTFSSILNIKRNMAQSIEVPYQQAYLNWYSDKLLAFSLGIINADGTPTGKLEDIRFTLDKLSVEEVEQQLATSQTTAEFIGKLRGMYFCTEGPDTVSQLPDVLFYQFYANGKEYGYSTDEEVNKATVQELTDWFNQFAQIELKNLSEKEDKVAVTVDELKETAEQLLAKHDFKSPKTDSNITVDSNGVHRLAKDYLNGVSVDYMGRKVATVTIYDSKVQIPIEPETKVYWDDIQISTYISNTQDVEENHVEPIYSYQIDLKINGTDFSFLATPDETGKFDVEDTVFDKLLEGAPYEYYRGTEEGNAEPSKSAT